VPDGPQKGCAYNTEIRVRFADCDAAGIVYYPRYLEMFNAVVEDWFRDELRSSFTEIVTNRNWGLPTVHLEVDFVAPSQFDEKLFSSLTVSSLGKSSLGLDIVLRGPDNQDRVRGKVVIVLIDRAILRATPWPKDLRARIQAFLNKGVVPRELNSRESLEKP
jgi:4-hydroxybenzoyl-CoA thioesterase